MTDIVERLRELARKFEGHPATSACRRAADEIERLRARNAELVGALRHIVDEADGDQHSQMLASVARAALAKAEEK